MNPAKLVQTAMILPGGLTWPDLKAGRSAVRYLPKEWPAAVGAPLDQHPPEPPDWPHGPMPRALNLAVAALRQLNYDPNRHYGLVLGLPSMLAEVEYVERCLQFRNEPAQIAKLNGFSFDFPLSYLASKLNTGPRLRLDSACASGCDALIVAAQWLQAGPITDVLVIAASAMLNPIGLALFRNLKALNPHSDLKASRPFDRQRRGFVMGEAAAAVWLSSDPTLSAQAFLVGYGQSMNAIHFVDLPDDTTAMEIACRQALGDLDRVAYVSAHGTATRRNDQVETALHERLFQTQTPKVPLSSIKSMVGHCLGAAGLIEAIVCVEALKEQIAPPTIHLSEPEYDLNYVAQKAQPIQGNFALSNTFAFGGANTSLLFAKEHP